ncbi:D-alanyl-D-alanine carboxypeptidase [Streptococcus pneumoniae]|nr:D-alanyl-D-alanine carboxypeptidase [Streptococcus pneumoniae]
MKKRYVILSGLLALTLAACSQEKPKVEENTQKTEQSSQPEGASSWLPNQRSLQWF